MAHNNAHPHFHPDLTGNALRVYAWGYGICECDLYAKIYGMCINFALFFGANYDEYGTQLIEYKGLTREVSGTAAASGTMCPWP